MLVKRLCLVIASMVLALMHTSAFANNCNTFGIENVPDEIIEFIEESQWSEWKVTGWVNPSGIRSEDACAFLAVKKGSANDLLAFGYNNGEWRYLWHNDAACPQVEESVVLSDNSEQSVSFASYYIHNDEIMESFCYWIQDANRTWHLSQMNNYYPLMFVDTSVENALHLYNTGWVDGEETDVWFYGAFQTDLQYFDLSRFPKTVEEARSYIGELPEKGLKTLIARIVEFPSNEKYKVYLGPGEKYGQAGNGKAVVSTNDWIQVFGTYNGWVLIQYQISDTHMRIGWISACALPEKAEIEKLAFPSIAASLVFDVDMTDDPCCSQMTVTSLPKGTDVTWLANLGSWAYIQCNMPQLVCGFIDKKALSVLVEN